MARLGGIELLRRVEVLRSERIRHATRRRLASIRTQLRKNRIGAKSRKWLNDRYRSFMAGRKLYRSCIVRTYYCENSETGKTPTGEEIADFRIEIVGHRKLGDKGREAMEKRLDRIEWTFKSIHMGRRHGNVGWKLKVDGQEENVPLDKGEAGIGQHEKVTFKGRNWTAGDIEIAEIKRERSRGYKTYMDKKRMAAGQMRLG